MNINRDYIIETFNNYVNDFNMNDVKIRLKYEHTLHVAKLCETISNSINLTNDAVNLSWLTGIFHDIGRFEQIKRYNTFNDSLSINHAELSHRLLFEDGLYNNYMCDLNSSELNYVEKSVLYHNLFRLPSDLNDTCILYCNILRDADKIDILRVNSEIPMEEIYNVTSDELKNSFITPEVLDQFYSKSAVLRSLKKTPLDNLIGHLSLVFELIFPISTQIVNTQGNIEKMLNFRSNNAIVNHQLDEIKSFISDHFSQS